MGCRDEHYDHWEYVSEKQAWCPICRKMRKY